MVKTIPIVPGYSYYIFYSYHTDKFTDFNSIDTYYHLIYYLILITMQ